MAISLLPRPEVKKMQARQHYHAGDDAMARGEGGGFVVPGARVPGDPWRISKGGAVAAPHSV